MNYNNATDSYVIRKLKNVRSITGKQRWALYVLLDNGVEDLIRPFCDTRAQAARRAQMLGGTVRV